MKAIQIILGSLNKIEDIVNIVKAALAGLETFTKELQKYQKPESKED